MNSAAKLRKRSVATLAASALLIGGVAPAAFAWDNITSGGSNTAGNGSIGMVDSDRDKTGTQGAQLVQAGQADQLAGEVRFVLPNTWETGDYLDFTLAAPAVTNPQTSADYVQWASLPDVRIDTKAYAASTRVADTSNSTSGTAGSVEDGKEVEWTNEVSNSTDKPIAPTFRLEPLTATPATKFRLVFTNSASNLPVTQTAKFIGTIRTPKITVGSSVTGQINLGVTSGGNGTARFVNDGGTAATTTGIATVSVARLTVNTQSIVADNTSQALGPITLAPASGGFTSTGDAGEPVAVTLEGGAFDTTVKGKAEWYDASGKLLNPNADLIAPDGDTITVGRAPATAAKLVLSGFNVSSGAQKMTFTVANGANAMSADAITDNLTGVHQTDIVAPGNATQVEIVNLLSVPADRMSGPNRYQTSVAAAKRLANGTTVSDVVIASGDSYADALSASYLAAVKNAPILLTQKDGLAPSAEEFLRTYAVKNVYIVGGKGVVSAAVEAKLKDTNATNATDPADLATVAPTTNKLSVLRLSGTDRFKTNRVANQFAVSSTTTGIIGSTNTTFGQPTKRTAILTTGMGAWDALSAGTLVGGQNAGNAGNDDLPIVLTAGSTLRQEAVDQFDTMGVQRAIVVGGTGVVPETVLKGMADAANVESIRLSGKDRYATNRAVLDFAMKAAPSATNVNGGFGWGTRGTDSVQPILANSGQPNESGWVDALAVAPLAAERGLPILITPATMLAPATKDALTAYASPLGATALVSGGFASVSEAVVSQANALIGS